MIHWLMSGNSGYGTLIDEYPVIQDIQVGVRVVKYL